MSRRRAHLYLPTSARRTLDNSTSTHPPQTTWYTACHRRLPVMEHPMRDTKPTLHSCRWLVRTFLLLTLGAILAACESRIPYRPLATVNLPNVTPIPGVATVEQQHYAYSLDSIATYETAGDRPTAHLLFLARQTVYDTTFDGGTPTTSNPAKNCTSRLRVSRDGAWLACDTYGGIEVAALNDNVSGTYSLAVSSTSQTEYVGDAAWAPDGRRIAAFHDTNDDCSIVIYSTQPPYTTSDVVMSLDLDEFLESIGGSQYICPVDDLTWSSDGAWLAFSAASGGYGPWCMRSNLFSATATRTQRRGRTAHTRTAEHADEHRRGQHARLVEQFCQNHLR